MEYILINAYCGKNIGDDLFLKIFIDHYPQKKFLLVGDPNNLQFLSNYSNVEIVNVNSLSIKDKIFLKLSLKSYAQIKKNKWTLFLDKYSKVISHYVILGGSMFMETNVNDFTTTDLINNKLSKAKKFVVGSNFGPYTTDEYCNYFKKLFTGYESVLFRDSYSKELFQNLANVKALTDFVFNFKQDFEIRKEAESIGISVMNFSGRKNIEIFSKDYIDFIRKNILKAKEDGKRCYLFSFCEKEKDHLVVQHIHKEFPEVIPVYYDGHIDSFLKKFASMETMIATRFHSLVLGLLFEQRIISIIYSNKTLNLINDINADIKYITLNDLEVHDVKDIDNLRVVDVGHVKLLAKKYFEEL